jgi:hypothetical protein
MRYSKTREAIALRTAMRQGKLTPESLAAAAGLTIRGLQNVAGGHSKSRRARQAISTIVRVEIWPGIFPKERWLGFERGDKTQFDTLEQAKEAAREFRGDVIRRRKIITFIRSASFVISSDSARVARALPNGKIFESVRGSPTPTPATPETEDNSPHDYYPTETKNPRRLQGR